MNITKHNGGNMGLKGFVFSLVLLICFSVNFPVQAAPNAKICSSALSLESNPSAEWLRSQNQLAIKHIVRNVSPENLYNKNGEQVVALPGTVLAARTDYYYYHWVRDAGLVMTTVVDQYRKAKSTEQQNNLEKKLYDYLNFSKHLQSLEPKTELEREKYSGLGEPKFNLDGTIYTGPWGRPQNDGPALRVISFINWANTLIDQGKIDFVRKVLYKTKTQQRSVIKTDLEFISHHWKQPSFDLWEEVRGDHFYTLMVQRKALVEGAKLARALNDHLAADWYSKQVLEIEKRILQFWDHQKGHFVATQNRVEGVHYKDSNLDTAVILGLLHGQTDDKFLKFSDARVLMTIEKLVHAFKKEYLINQNPKIPGVAMGRYPEDEYAGSYGGYKQGNPWVLTTLAIAEAYYKAASELKAQNRWSEAEMLIVQGDQFVERVKYHAHPSGSLNEQMHRDSGYMTSVEDLTWNYAAILTTDWARKEAIK